MSTFILKNKNGKKDIKENSQTKESNKYKKGNRKKKIKKSTQLKQNPHTFYYQKAKKSVKKRIDNYKQIHKLKR